MNLELYTATGRRIVTPHDADYAVFLTELSSRKVISNEIGTVITYSGPKPQYMIPPKFHHRCDYCGARKHDDDNCSRCGAPE